MFRLYRLFPIAACLLLVLSIPSFAEACPFGRILRGTARVATAPLRAARAVREARAEVRAEASGDKAVGPVRYFLFRRGRGGC